MNTLIAICCIIILVNLIKSLFKGKSINQSSDRELIKSRSEFRANARKFR